MTDQPEGYLEDLKQRRDQLPEPELSETQKELAAAIAAEILEKEGITANKPYVTFHDIERIARISVAEGMKYEISRSDDTQGEQ